MHTLALALAASSVVFAAAASAAVPEAARAQLATSGKLRAGMNLSNTLFMTKDASSGELRGVSVDLMRELASRLEVPVEFVVYPTPGDGVYLDAWNSECTVVDYKCLVTLTGNTNVTATFTLDTHLLAVSVMGNGRGDVLVNPIMEPQKWPW